MSLPPRCLLAGLLACTGCFAPNGLSETTGDPGTTGPPPTTGTSAPPDTDSETTPTSAPGSTSSTGEPTTEPASASSSDTTDGTTTRAAVCGDGVREGEEECDDGLLNADDRACTSACKQAFCGDGVVCPSCDPLELCDDGGMPNAGCSDDCKIPICGDGVLGDGEECEPPNLPEQCTADCLYPQHYVFVSSEVLRGDQVLDGDDLCDDLAQYKFSPKRKFIAWVSSPGNPVVDRMGPGYYEYVKPFSNEVVAASRGELLDGFLETPIDTNELGEDVQTEEGCGPVSAVWTGTESNGFAGTSFCGSWDDVEMTGQVGMTSQLDSRWSNGCQLACSNELPVYCIEKTL